MKLTINDFYLSNFLMALGIIFMFWYIGSAEMKAYRREMKQHKANMKKTYPKP